VFPVPVLAIGRAILLSDATVVAGGEHAEVGAKLVVAAGGIPRVARVTVAEAAAAAVCQMSIRLMACVNLVDRLAGLVLALHSA